MAVQQQEAAPQQRFSCGKGRGSTNSVLRHPNPEPAACELCWRQCSSKPSWDYYFFLRETHAKSDEINTREEIGFFTLNKKAVELLT